MKKIQKRGRKGTTAVILCITLALLTGCQDSTITDQASQEIEVEVSNPIRSTISVESSFIGTIEPLSEVVVMPKIAGEVLEANFEVGDQVKEGDLLFTIDDSAIQISLSSAVATYESAQAGLLSAQASLKAQEASHVLAEATAAETIGKMDTNEMELNASVEKAQNAVGASKGNEALSKQAFSSAQSVAENVEDNLEILKTNKNNAEAYYNSLAGVRGKYSAIATNPASDEIGLEQLASENGVSTYSYTPGDTAQTVAEVFLNQATTYAGVSELDAAIATAKSSITTMESSVNSTEGSYDSYITAQVQAAIGMGTASDTVATAEQAKTLAEKYKQDYETYTKAKIVAGANASLAGADATLAGAQASITNAGSSIKSAKANLDSINLQLENTKIKAPVSGLITAINVSEHNMASNTTQAYVIQSSGSSKVVFYVAEKSISQIKNGNEVKLEKNGEEYTGRVSFVGSSVDSTTGLFKVEAVMKEGHGSLLSGTSVTIKAITKKAENVLLIPISAIYYESERAFVYLFESGTAKKVEVIPGIAEEEKIEIISGVGETSQLITSWDSQMKDGALVAIAGEGDTNE